MSNGTENSTYPILEAFDSWAGLEQYGLEFIHRHKAIKISENDDSVVLAITKESDPDLLVSRLRAFHSGKDINFVSVDTGDFHAALARLYSAHKGVEESLDDSGDSTPLERISGDAPTVNLVNGIILEAVRANASDIHIEQDGGKMRVRYRIDGMLRVASELPAERFSSVSSRIKLMANLNVMETRKPQDGRLTATLGGTDIHMRLSVVPLVRGESLVLRIFRRAGDLLNSDSLGLPSTTVAALRCAFHRNQGLILVTGPTGSGKTTTLDSFLSEIRDDRRKIITLEDPVEYIIDGVDQIQVNEAIGLGFGTLLRRVLRQDPDVIMVGEIRDEETASLAVRAALTGHLVLATLHTNDAASAILRLVDMGIPRYLLAAVLRGVLAQRLVRRLCPMCGSIDTLSDADRVISDSFENPINSTGVAVGCGRCEGTGYRGRTAVSEWFEMDNELVDTVSRTDTRTTDILKILESRGFMPLVADALNKVESGITTIDELRRKVVS